MKICEIIHGTSFGWAVGSSGNTTSNFGWQFIPNAQIQLVVVVGGNKQRLSICLIIAVQAQFGNMLGGKIFIGGISIGEPPHIWNWHNFHWGHYNRGTTSHLELVHFFNRIGCCVKNSLPFGAHKCISKTKNPIREASYVYTSSLA